MKEIVISNFLTQIECIRQEMGDDIRELEIKRRKLDDLLDRLKEILIANLEETYE